MFRDGEIIVLEAPCGRSRYVACRQFTIDPRTGTDAVRGDQDQESSPELLETDWVPRPASLSNVAVWLRQASVIWGWPLRLASEADR